MSKKKSSAELQARIDALNLPEMHIVFYHNIDGIDFYQAPLGSDDRLARNVNVIAFFNSKDELKRFYTNVMLSTISQEPGEQISMNQKLYYCLVDAIHETLTNNIDMDSLIKEVEQDPDTTFRKIVSKLPFYDNLKGDVFDVMKEHHPDGYDVYSDDKFFTYTEDQKKLLLYAFTQMNTLFSMYALAMNTDKNADLFIVKLKPEEILQVWELFTADFQGSMNEEAEKADFPMYHVWKGMEKEFYQRIDKKKKPFDEYINSMMKEETSTSGMTALLGLSATDVASEN